MTNRPRSTVKYLPGEKRINLQGCRLCHDEPFIEAHVYRTPRRIEMGPIVAAALEAIFERRWRRAARAD